MTGLTIFILLAGTVDRLQWQRHFNQLLAVPHIIHFFGLRIIPLEWVITCLSKRFTIVSS